MPLVKKRLLGDGRKKIEASVLKAPKTKYSGVKGILFFSLFKFLMCAKLLYKIKGSLNFHTIRLTKATKKGMKDTVDLVKTQNVSGVRQK